MKALGKRSIASFVNSVLNITWWCVVAGLGLLVILLACSIFVELRGDNLTMSLPVAVQLNAPIHGADGETSAHFEQLRGNLRFPAKKGVFLFGSVAVVALMLGYVLWIVTQLRYVFRSLSRGLPFDPANARRVRQVGLAVIFGELGRAAIIYYWSYYTSSHFVADGLRFVPSIDMNPITIVGGLAILIIAEVFREGARMQEDQSLTI
jgi:hypothetical protein